MEKRVTGCILGETTAGYDDLRQAEQVVAGDQRGEVFRRRLFKLTSKRKAASLLE